MQLSLQECSEPSFNLQDKMAGLLRFMFSVAFGAFTVTLAVPSSDVLSFSLQLFEHGMLICWRLSINLVDGFEIEVASI